MDPTTAGAVVFLAFTTSGCAPCGRLHADFAHDPQVRFLDAEANPDAVKQHRVTRYPTVIAMRDGLELRRKVGYTSRRDMREWMDQCDGTLVRALRILAREIQSDDGVANACIAEAANAIERMLTELASLRLTDAEREAVSYVCVHLLPDGSREGDAAIDTLRGLLERTGGERCYSHR